MFESSERLAHDAVGLLDVLREMGGGRYACVVDRKRGVMLETPETDWPIRRHLDERKDALFAIQAAMAADTTPEDDVFEPWPQDDFFLVFVNGRAAIVVACDDGEAVREGAERPLRALVDRLLRLEPSWRLDTTGRGLFMGSPRLDILVAGRHDES